MKKDKSWSLPLCCLVLCFLVSSVISAQVQQGSQYSFTYGQYPNIKIVESGKQKFQFLPAGEVMPEGWIKKQMLIDAEGYLPAEEKMCPQISREPFFKRADLWGPCTWWNGEQTSYWIDGMVRLAYLTEHKDLEEQVTEWMDKLLKTQGEDGYIGLYPSMIYRWEDGSCELWPQCHVYRAMLAYYDFTKRQDIWNSLLRAANLTTKHFDGGKHWVTSGETDLHALMMAEPMLELYSRTGNANYLNYARNMVEYSKDSDYYLGNMWKAALSGHGVHVIEHLRVPAMLYSYTGNLDYLNTSINCCNIIKNEYLNSNGAPKSDESVDGGAAPNRANEYCDITEWMETTSMMLAITGDAKYGDWEEKVVFNAAQGARGTDGKGIQYLSFPNQIEAKAGQYAYRPDHWPMCCNPMAGRLMPYYVERSWMRTSDGNGLIATTYGPSLLQTWVGRSKTEVTILEETNYPFEEYINFTIDVDSPTKFDLWLRIPSWCREPVVGIGNRSFIGFIPGSFAKITRSWKKGDAVTLYLPMPIKVEKDRFNLVTVNRGPLVYSLQIPANVINLPMNEGCMAVKGITPKGYIPSKGAKWSYALILDEMNPEEAFEIRRVSAFTNISPWEAPPLQLKVKAQPMRDWGWIVDEQGGLASNIPESSVKSTGKAVSLTLIPYGFTRLRITSFPYVKTDLGEIRFSSCA